MACLYSAPLAWNPTAVDTAIGVERIGLLAGDGVAAAESVGEVLPEFQFPPNNGFLGPTGPQTLNEGELIDRYGGTDVSRFFSPADTPMEARALPPGVGDQPLRTFEVVQPFDVEAGTVAPFYGQPGLGTQFRSPMTLQQLIQQGYLREITQ